MLLTSLSHRTLGEEGSSARSMLRTDNAMEISSFQSLSINITNRCNTVCAYCFRGHTDRVVPEVSIDVGCAHRVLQFFRAKSGSWPPVAYQYVHLSGGEPLMHPNVFEIVRLCLEYGFRVRLQTNGIALHSCSDDEIRLMAHPFVYVKVSVDGSTKEIHERYRQKGTFDPIVAGLRRLRAASVKFGIKTVITRANVSRLEDILEFCYRMGAMGFSYNMLRREGSACHLHPQDGEAISELDIVKRLVPLLSQDRYRHLIGGTDVLRYLTAAHSWEPACFIINYDGHVYPTRDCDPVDVLGNAYASNMDAQFPVSRLRGYRIEYPLDVVKYVKTHLMPSPGSLGFAQEWATNVVFPT